MNTFFKGQGDLEQQVAAQCAKIPPPPLGIVPREIHRANRIGNILGAIWRYVDADKLVPDEWASELQQLIGEHNAGKGATHPHHFSINKTIK